MKFECWLVNQIFTKQELEQLRDRYEETECGLFLNIFPRPTRVVVQDHHALEEEAALLRRGLDKYGLNEIINRRK